MPIFVSEGNGKDWTPAPAGLAQAVCVDVVDLGVQEVTYAGDKKLVHRVRLWWALDEIDPVNAENYRVMRTFTASLHKKASLRAFLETWRGRPFSKDELEKFDLEKLIGVNAQLQINHNRVNDRTYANVASAVALGKGMKPIAVPADYVRIRDRVTVEHDEDEDHMPDAEDDDARVPF